MKSACCWLLVLLSLVAASQAIKCLCEKTLCLDDAAELSEECPARLDKDYFTKHPSELTAFVEKGLANLLNTHNYLAREVNARSGLSSDQIIFLINQIAKWKKKAKELMGTLSLSEQIRLIESVTEIGRFLLEHVKEGKVDVSGLKAMMEQAFKGTYEPKQVDYSFCIKKLDGKGITSRSCGLKGVDFMGPEMELGCHNNPKYDAMKNDYPKYCRCDTDLCNSGDVGVTEEDNASSSPKLSSFLLAGSLMRVCFSVVMSQICRT